MSGASSKKSNVKENLSDQLIWSDTDPGDDFTSTSEYLSNNYTWPKSKNYRDGISNFEKGVFQESFPASNTLKYVTDEEKRQFILLEQAYFEYWSKYQPISKFPFRNGNISNIITGASYILTSLASLIPHSKIKQTPADSNEMGGFGCTATSNDTYILLANVIDKENVAIFRSTGEKKGFKWTIKSIHLPGHNTVAVFLYRFGRELGFYFDPWIYQYPCIFSSQAFDKIMKTNKDFGFPTGEH